MRKNSMICLIVLIFLSSAIMFAQTDVQYLQHRILASFDDQLEGDFLGNSFSWIVRANGGNVIVRSEEGEELRDPEPISARFQTYPRALYNRNNPPPENPQALGIRASFLRQGYNYLEFIPVYADNPNKGIPIPGIATQLDLWVWGSNHNYYMEVHLRDYRGVEHVINLGSLYFNGWRNVSGYVPNIIPQADFHNSLGKVLELTKIVLWTTPNEKVDGFSVYLDEVKVFTNVFSAPYDGDSLADPDNPNTIEALWKAQEAN